MKLIAALLAITALSTQAHGDPASGELPVCLKGLKLRIFSTDSGCEGCETLEKKLKEAGRLKGLSGALELSWRGHPVRIPITVVKLGYDADAGSAEMRAARNAGFSGLSLPEIVLLRDETPFSTYDRGVASTRITEQFQSLAEFKAAGEGFESEPRYFDPQLIYFLNHPALLGSSPDHRWWATHQREVTARCAEAYKELTAVGAKPVPPENVDADNQAARSKDSSQAKAGDSVKPAAPEAQKLR